jgi:hypothetical protein
MASKMLPSPKTFTEMRVAPPVQNDVDPLQGGDLDVQYWALALPVTPKKVRDI